MVSCCAVRGFGEEVALDQAAAEELQFGGLGGGFYTFGEGVHAEDSREPDDGFGDGGATGGAVEFATKLRSIFGAPISIAPEPASTSADFESESAAE